MAGGRRLGVKVCERHSLATLLREKIHQHQQGRCPRRHQHRQLSDGGREKYLPLLGIEAWSSSPKFGQCNYWNDMVLSYSNEIKGRDERKKWCWVTGFMIWTLRLVIRGNEIDYGIGGTHSTHSGVRNAYCCLKEKSAKWPLGERSKHSSLACQEIQHILW